MNRPAILIILVFILLSSKSFSQPLNSKYSCGLTQEEYEQTKEFIKKRKKLNRIIVKRLRKIEPEYARHYADLSTKEEQIEYIEFLINHEFHSIKPHDPKHEKVIDFLKTFDFTIVSAKDMDRCAPIITELQKKYDDKIAFSYTPISKSGCIVNIYGITSWERIDDICCFLKKVSDQYKVGSIELYFFESEAIESTSEAKAITRGKESLIDKIIINYMESFKEF